MALTATMYAFEVRLSDTDRDVYETVPLRLARQPSETAEYLVTRALAYCLEHTEGLAFSRGLAEPDEPTLAVRDLTGALTTWIDVGTPDAARIHKASKAAARVVVYTHKDPALLVEKLAAARIHRAEAVEIYAVDRALVAALAERLARRLVLDLAVTDRHVYVTLDGAVFDGAITRFPLAAA
jgi:uncharacterized protein YaeQ